MVLKCLPVLTPLRAMLKEVSEGQLPIDELVTNLGAKPRFKEVDELQALLPKAVKLYSTLKQDATSAGSRARLDLLYTFQCLSLDVYKPTCAQLTKAGLPCKNPPMELGEGSPFAGDTSLRTCNEHKEVGSGVGTSQQFLLSVGSARRFRSCGVCAETKCDDPICCRLCPTWTHLACVLETKT